MAEAFLRHVAADRFEVESARFIPAVAPMTLVALPLLVYFVADARAR